MARLLDTLKADSVQTAADLDAAADRVRDRYPRAAQRLRAQARAAAETADYLSGRIAEIDHNQPSLSDAARADAAERRRVGR